MTHQCRHVNAYRHRHGGSAAFNRLQAALRCLLQSNEGQEARLRQSMCTPIVCLQCAATFATCAEHRDQHSSRLKAGHELAIDLRQQQLYCGACGLYVCDTDFDHACKAANASAGFRLSGMPEAEQFYQKDAMSAIPVVLKRKWQQTGQDEVPAAKQARLQVKLEGAHTRLVAGDSFAAGLRGLNNLGNTCFMNTILQVFLHVPQLQAYFLGGGHMNKLCPKQTPVNKPGSCLSCELDTIFAEAYGGVRRPYSPVRFLDTWWRNAEGSLAGYQQQDAHEFYLSLLDGLGQASDKYTPSASGSPSPAPTSHPDLDVHEEAGHLAAALSLEAWRMPLKQEGHAAGNGAIDLITSSSGSERSSQERTEEDIEQTMDRFFGGILRSDVVCACCGYTSTAHDPFKDISVDILEPPNPKVQPPAVDVPKPNPVSASKGMKFGAKPGYGKVSTKGGKAGLLGVKRKMDAVAEKEGLEPSDAGLSETSAFPATTETSARCDTPDDQSSVAGQAQAENDQTVSSPLHPSADPGQPYPAPLHPPAQPKAGLSGRKAKQKGKGAKSAKANASQQPSVQLQPSRQHLERESDLMDLGQAPAADGDDNEEEEDDDRDDDFATNGKASAQGHGNVAKKGQKGKRGGAPKSAGGAVKKPTRCQKCYTCLHKQLKKQCLRNKALISPTDKNIKDALQGGVDAAELSPVLSQDAGGGSESPRALMPDLQHSKASAKRQKPWQQDLAQPSISDFLPQHSEPQHSEPQPSEPQSSELGEPDEGMLVDSTYPPPPLPTRITPNSAPAEADAPQVSLQQQQQQHSSLNQLEHVNRSTDAAREAVERFQRSVSQQVVQAVPCGGQGQNGSGAVGLQGCLHRFVHPETLSRWTCSRCECERAAFKQMSIRQLPPVLCLHMKRFKATDKGATKKVDSPVSFPVSHLDMAPFTSAPVLAKRCHLISLLQTSQPSDRLASGTAAEACQGKTLYRLHGVVCHKGNLQGGHYIAYVRCGEFWYEFDDARVTLVQEETVRLSSAYMLFYLQQ